jgi:3-deoxy-manno-octulosonate cytidylyltransferase (CMP-KDO synthetase)
MGAFAVSHRKRNRVTGVVYAVYIGVMHTAIIIPARYGSTRLSGKPLALIQGQTMLSRVVAIARNAANHQAQTSVYVATDDARIQAHCEELGVTCILTSADAASGTDRAAEAVAQLNQRPDFILNFQGDAPLTPPDFLIRMIESFRAAPCDVVTPVTQLTWAELEGLKESKRTTPLSGTCAVFNPSNGEAFWFSKQIIPAIRNEAALKAASPLSPVYRHIGLYGYSYDMLLAYGGLPVGAYETLEGLEQLRILEHGYRIRCVPVAYAGRANMSGVDSPEDIVRAEALIEQHGELF